MDDRDRLVGIYLQDHLAGSVLALELLGRARRSNEENELGAFLADLGQEVAADRDVLLEVMRILGVEPSRAKNGLAWAAEKVGRLKLNGRLLRSSPLSRVLELEALEAGITGKRSLWTNLEVLDDPRFARFDFPRLAGQAETQRAAVEEWRRRAAGALRAAGRAAAPSGRPPAPTS